MYLYFAHLHLDTSHHMNFLKSAQKGKEYKVKDR